MTYLLIFNHAAQNPTPVRRLIETLEANGHKVVAEPLEAKDAQIIIVGDKIKVSSINRSDSVKTYNNVTEFVAKEFFV